MISWYRSKGLLGTVGVWPTISPLSIAVPLMAIFPSFCQLCIYDWTTSFIQASTVKLPDQSSGVMGHAATEGGD
jgi:hypothetical protein